MENRPEEEMTEDGGLWGWIRDNSGKIIAVLIILVLIWGIYGLSRRGDEEETSQLAETEDVAEEQAEAAEETLTEAQALEEGSVEEVVRESKPEVVAGAIDKQGNEFIVSAGSGEGVTHLARRATKQYLQDSGISDLSAEHKVYIEDYLKDRADRTPLAVGEQRAFTENDVQAAIDASRQLNEAQLENLKRYTSLISSEQLS